MNKTSDLVRHAIPDMLFLRSCLFSIFSPVLCTTSAHVRVVTAIIAVNREESGFHGRLCTLACSLFAFEG